MKFTSEYAEHIRTGIIARLLEKEKEDIIHWYEMVKEVKTNKRSKQRIVKGYSITPENVTPENVNMKLYKKLLVSKLKDTLGLVGLNLSELDYDFARLNDSISQMRSH